MKLEEFIKKLEEKEASILEAVNSHSKIHQHVAGSKANCIQCISIKAKLQSAGRYFKSHLGVNPGDTSPAAIVTLIKNIIERLDDERNKKT